MRRFWVGAVAFAMILTVAGPVAAGPVGLVEKRQWSEWGHPGQEQGIAGAIDVGISRGKVFVSAEGEGMIHVFTKSGDYLRSFEAATPHGLTVDRKYVYNASWGEAKVQIFTKTGHLVNEWSSWDEDGTPMSFILPLFIDVDSKGFIYVTDNVLGQVRKFNRHGEWITTFGDGATAVSVKGKRVYVTNPEGKIDVFTRSGRYLRSFGDLNDPRGIEVAGKYIYVAETSTRRLLQFTLSGELVSEVFVPNTERLDGVGADARGNVYVTDQFTNLVTWYKAR